jgi:uncharacterized protein YkwD
MMKNKILLFCGLLFIAACTPSTADNTPTNIENTNVSIETDEKYMTTREQEMIAEINLVRSNPRAYAQIIEQYIVELKTDRYSDASYIGEEIKTAKELIKELKTTEPMLILQPHKGLYKAAKKHGEEGKKKGELDHQGSDGLWPWDRAVKYASDLTESTENLVGGPEKVRRSVIILLVDTGIESRGHRKAILNPNWRYVTCYEVGQVGDMPNYWVQMFGK